MRTLLSTAAFAAALGPLAASPVSAADGRVARVTVYPGSATVERTATVRAGARSLTFSCLPASLDARSLNATAGADVNLGEVTVDEAPRAASAACAVHPLDARIRALEVRRDTLQADSAALDLVAGYLKGFGAPPEADTGGRRGAPEARQLVATADALRRTGQDALSSQRRLARELADLERELAPLVAERDRSTGGQDARVVHVTVALESASEAEVTLRYQVAGPSWQPAYRALLDTATRRVRLERQALVAQATGEDWRGVALTLSTGQPRQATAGRGPVPWQVGLLRLERDLPDRRDERSLGMVATAPMPAPAPRAALATARPRFEIAEVEGALATTFTVSRPVDVASNGPSVSLALGRHEGDARVFVRTTPRVDASAFLVADLATPPGVWPAGPLQLYRDGAYVGPGRFDASQGPRVALSFGRDERVRVTVEPEQRRTGTAGLTGGRAELTVRHAFVVENRHGAPMSLEVLDAAPVSVDEAVRIATRFTPEPAERSWRALPGVAQWAFDLAPGATARVAAEHVIDHPKDRVLTP